MESIRLFLIEKIKEKSIVEDILYNYHKDKYNIVLEEFNLKKKMHYFKDLDTHIAYSKQDKCVYSTIYGITRDNAIFKYTTNLYILVNYDHHCVEKVFTTLHGGKLKITSCTYYENEGYD